MTDKITLLNIDCMDYMRGVPDKYFDLAIVDPPFNVGASDGSFGNRGYDSKTSKLKHYTNHNKTPDKNYFDELFRVSKNQIIWGMNYYPQFLYHSGSIVWHKKNDNPLSDCEIAFQSFNKLVKYVWCEWQGFLKGGETTTRIHPNQKPLNLYKWLLKNYATPSMKILDTHLGSGSSAIAAHYFGCEFVGTEIDKDYYDAAVKRFKLVTSQTSIFQ
jgi:site-specific DNA-methyltransferase (adenine-specific)